MSSRTCKLRSLQGKLSPSQLAVPKHPQVSRLNRRRACIRLTSALTDTRTRTSFNSSQSIAEQTGQEDPQTVVRVRSAVGVRIHCGEAERKLEYLVRVADSDVSIWVSSEFVAEDVKEAYEKKWWLCCRKGNIEDMNHMLRGGGQALVAARDSDNRGALHYACGVGSDECVRSILAYGADVNAKDKDGFTALHIAAGYLHEKVVEVLVASGADPEIQDNTGRSPLDLVETLMHNTPATTVTFARRSALESISDTLEQYSYEEVPPASIKAARPAGDGGDEYLIEWLDERMDSWVPENNIADNLIKDFKAGIEYAPQDKVYTPPTYAPSGIKIKTKSATLVKWADGAPPSWEAPI